MKGLSMAISSPVPELLIKQLSRNNAGSGSGSGSGSRSKSSSPIFYTKHSAAGITAHEPYSPKVTCIGQVRHRKFRRRRRRRCWFMKGKFLWRRSRAFWRSLCKWVFLGYCKKVDLEEDCERKIDFLGENGDRNNHVEIRFGENRSCSPPKNALMLTRFSRSAPYRASTSLGERIRREKLIDESSAAAESEGFKSENDQVQEESRIGQQNGGVSENPRNTNTTVGDLEGNIPSASVALSLTRSKSQPTTTGEIIKD